jgi:hypothetical protein
MNECGFIGQDIFVGSEVSEGKSATINKFKSRRGYVRSERLVSSSRILGTYSSSLAVVGNSSTEILGKKS